MTNRDKKESIRGRMADTGESFNVARRKLEATASGQIPDGEDRCQLIGVEVGTDAKFPDRSPDPRHIGTFWGRTCEIAGICRVQRQLSRDHGCCHPPVRPGGIRVEGNRVELVLSPRQHIEPASRSAASK